MIAWVYEVLGHAGPAIMAIAAELDRLLLLVLICTLVQVLFPATKRRFKMLSYEGWLDFLYAFQSGLLGLTALGAGREIAIRWISRHTPGLFLQELPFAAQLVIAVWAFDFVVYWRHRLEHRLSFLWPIHAVHHTSTQVDFLTTKRLHFLEWMIGGTLTGLVFTRLGLSGRALGLGFAIYLYHNYYIHTNVRIRYPGFLKYLLVSPFMHRWHHATDIEARDRNFGVVFAWNDWLFGTAYHPAHEPTSFGLIADPTEQVSESYIAHQLYPFRVLVQRLVRRFRVQAPASEH